MTLDITSNAFTARGSIPKKYTGEGADVSPPLAKMPPVLVLFGFPQFFCGSLDTSFWTRLEIGDRR